MKKTIYASSMFFACALAFVSCGQKTPEMTLEEIEDYRAHAGQHLLERTVYKPYTGQEFIPGKEGGIWNNSILADPKTFNHLIAERDGSSSALVEMTTEWLVDYDPIKKEWIPKAAFFEVETDEEKGTLTVHYTLRDEMVWSWYGKKETASVTSDDIVYWYNEIEGDEVFQSSGYGGQFLELENGEQGHIECVKVDDRKFDFVFPRIVAEPLLTTNCSIKPSFIYKKAKEEKGADGVKDLFNASGDPKEIPSCGKWQFAEYKPAQRIVYRRNPNYWEKDSNGKTIPYQETMICQIVGDQNTSYLLFKQGKLESYGPRPEEVDEVVNSQKNGYTVYRADGSFSAPFWSFNQNPKNKDSQYYKWFCRKEFRQAMSCLLNRERIIQQTYRGLGDPCYSFFAKPNAFYDEKINLKYRYNVEQAKELLAKAGIKPDAKGVMRDWDNVPVEFDLTINASSSTTSDIAQIIADECSLVGIKVNVRQTDFQKIVEMLTSTYDWQSLIISLSGGSIFPSQGSNVWVSYGNLHLWYPLQPKPATEWEARVDWLYNNASYTIDKVQAKKYWDEYQEIYLEQCPIIYLVSPRSFYAIQNKWNQENFYYDNMYGARTEYVFAQ
nr:ABC transporter substrate-binding protein [uncultured Treponema sp.]